MKKLTLSQHYTYKAIILQCLAPILMMIFTSLYTVVDGLFISNVAGDNAFAGINLIAPIIMIVGGIGFMFGSGGSALASKFLGEKRNEDANKVFAMMLEMAFGVVLIVGIICFFFVDQIVYALAKIDPSTKQETIEYAITYGKILLVGQPIFAASTIFHNFFIVNETPQQGFIQTLIAGLTNVVLDAILICGFKLEVTGAAIATILGYAASLAYGIIYFYKKKNQLIKIDWCKPNFKFVMKSATNGSSDFIFNISSSVVSIIYNIQLLKYFHQDGVNAYGAIMYISFIFLSIFIGIVIGMGPVISYNYGAKNHKELKSVVNKLIIITAVLSVAMTAIAEISARGLALAFTRNEAIVELTTKAIRLYSFAFLFAGFGILTTSLFTSLNNGLISGLISFVRTLVFNVVLLFLLPEIFGADSLWWSIIVVEFLAAEFGFIFYFAKRKEYHY